MIQTKTRLDSAQELVNNFWGTEYKLMPMQGDAGLRRYFRITDIQGNYTSTILMDSPPEYSSVGTFEYLADYLNNNEFYAPSIYEADIERGFLIIQDLGTTSLKDAIIDARANGDEARATTLYSNMIDILIKLKDTEPPLDIPIYSNDKLLSELDIFLKFYPKHYNDFIFTEEDLTDYKEIWTKLLNSRPVIPSCPVLRDYHTENLMLLDSNINEEDEFFTYDPENEEDVHNRIIKSIGLLDFQDMLIGSPIYDLVSVLEDARIEVSPELAKEMIEYYAKKTGLDLEDIIHEYHILGAQRNSRIIGVFIRKYLRDNDDSYLQYLPLMFKYLRRDLSHPKLESINNWYQEKHII
jgi:aminoglycoside/choline kinase family phosphotransferase